ncbi:tRNA lysidine(34) synthetase TilS [Neobacillus ginsengisoli]|uniref:tRNA(Ile)-lysidine synthase n=1 Tax=Neobacillus ginsengisoli TaxID=904295 RepID=A0ABT9Y2W8_9BACI|nr:tRNA lysidine(34) synthetase TilS [Neobacillus ginsengisoli]MDQ0202142.1 tRNA(Ile)-lysidine synthase [Neobacillus ginsengisoli]
MLETKVEAFLNRHSFKLENLKMVVGVSGGPDSLALLHYLKGQKEVRNLSIVVAHVDHMFRGRESFEDALFVKHYCEQYTIPFEMVRINVPELIKQTGNSSQIAAREARYEFYAKIMEKYNYPYLALGHHGDDQMETMLMRMTRGSSGKARAGIPFTRAFHKGIIFRPFLNLTKAEIEEYCKEQGLTPRLDPSNMKSTYSRNRFRKEVLPFLKLENRHVHEHFQRFSEELQSDETFLQELTVQQMNTVMTKREKNKITIDVKRFSIVPIPLQRRGIQLILKYLYNEKPGSLSAIHIDQVLSLMQNSHPSGKLDLPHGLHIIRSYLNMSFQFDSVNDQTYHFEVHEPGTIELPCGGRIKMSFIDREFTETNLVFALFHVDKIKMPFIIRTRKIGDRMTLKGMSGTRKLKDIFIDRKVSIRDRDTWPVITDAEGTILWLPGLKKSSLEGIDYKAKQYILLTYDK